jgi:hypothetical protein
VCSNTGCDGYSEDSEDIWHGVLSEMWYGTTQAFDSIRGKTLALVDTVLEASDDGDSWQVYVTGHSLGGALATLMSALLAQSVASGRRKLQLTMYNYGSPRVGNGAFVQEYNQLVPDSFRVRPSHTLLSPCT